MSFCEQAAGKFLKILDSVPEKFSFRMHGSFRYPVYPDWKSNLQNYADLHILYVRAGEGTYHMHNGTDIPLTRGTLVFISHGVEHHASVNAENPLQIAGLRFGLYDSTGLPSTQKLADSFYYFIHPGNPQFYNELTGRLHQLYHKKKDAVTQKVCAALLYQILFEMYATLTCGPTDKSHDLRIKEVRQRIENHPYKKICIPDLAKAAGISTRYLQKRFKEDYGLTPKEYHLQVQMNLALTLLELENLSVTEVAERLGYADLFTFSKQFKKHFGYPPIHAKAQFRKPRGL